MAERVVYDYFDECGEIVWVTRYGEGWQFTYRPGATVSVEVVDG